MRVLFLLLLGFSAPLLTAQSEPRTPSIHIVGKYTPDGTVLRWGYGDVDTWLANYREGVILERRQVQPDPGSYAEIARLQLLDSVSLEMQAAATGSDMLGTLHATAYQDWENSRYTGEGDDFMAKRDNLNNRYVFFHYAADRDREVAEAAGLSYTDRDRQAGATYAYRVRTRGKTTAIGIKVIPPNPNRARPLVQSVREDEGSIILSWDRALHDRHFSGYYIERSTNEGRDWSRLNDLPYVQGYDKRHLGEAPATISYTDRVPNGEPTGYRLIGLDAFGDESPPSPTVVAQARDRTPPPRPELRADESVKTHLTKTLLWRQEPGEETVTYHLARQFNNQPSVRVDFAATGDTLMLDTLDEAGTYQYRLAAQDSAGNLAWSEPYTTIVHDLDRPAAPTGLEARTDTNGVVTLTWDTAKEKDVVGYYVFAADGEGRAFSKLTGTSYPYRQFRDTVSLRLGNQYRYYRVMALDKDFLYSDFSDTLRVVRPDVIPPAPAHVSDFRIVEGGVHLNLRHSNSSDAHRHQLLRRTKGENTYRVQEEWTYPPFNYVDTTVKAGTTYLYGYRGVDLAGNEGAVPSWVQVTTKLLPLAPPVLDTFVRNDIHYLSWEPRSDAQAWQLYRQVGGEKEIRLVTLAGDSIIYMDGRQPRGRSLRYRLRYVGTDGRRSAFSEPVSIQLP